MLWFWTCVSVTQWEHLAVDSIYFVVQCIIPPIAAKYQKGQGSKLGSSEVSVSLIFANAKP